MTSVDQCNSSSGENCDRMRSLFAGVWTGESQIVTKKDDLCRPCHWTWGGCAVSYWEISSMCILQYPMGYYPPISWLLSQKRPIEYLYHCVTWAIKLFNYALRTKFEGHIVLYKGEPWPPLMIYKKYFQRQPLYSTLYQRNIILTPFFHYSQGTLWVTTNVTEAKWWKEKDFFTTILLWHRSQEMYSTKSHPIQSKQSW